jgi:isochorismate synthase
MDIVFTGIATSDNTNNTIGAWSLIYDRQHLLSILRQASQQAAQSNQPVLVSFTQPVASCHPLRIFHAFRLLEVGERFYWELPTEQRVLIGAGAATTIETSGSHRFTTASTIWRRLQAQAIVVSNQENLPENLQGPMLFGGFAFDPAASHTSLWNGFPDGLLIVPYLLFRAQEDGATLTVNKLIQEGDDIERCAEEMYQHVHRLHQTVESTSEAQLLSKDNVNIQLTTRDLLPANTWKELVTSAVAKIRAGYYQKVVLARGMQASSEEAPFDVETTLSRLRVSYPGAYVFALQRGERYFVGATPERLLRTSGSQIFTMALAGSAPRGNSEEEDQQLDLELLQSAKNQGEHAIVVTMIRDALAHYCSQVWVSDKPQVLRLKNIQHLQTPIVGELLPGQSILDALQELHPTPAVGGFPREAALRELREYEQLDRGWYAGPIGWINANGNGEFAVALRSALVDTKSATLFAGGGIVADSQPESEYSETCWKFAVMLRGLGGED